MKQEKKLEVFHSSTFRGIVDMVNSKGIAKEDIVQIVPTEEGAMLFYYI